MEYIFEKATINDLENIYKLYEERAEWFKKNNIDQWDSYFTYHPKSDFINAIKDKRFYIIKQESEIIASFELSSDSNCWNDSITSAYYLYKVVTKVNHKNLGKLIFDKCREIAIKDNKKFLRLNCIESNVKLNEIYESYNFKFVRNIKSNKYVFSLRQLEL
ncbi:MAG: GNAT family N-acetyltransferase [Bacilli bacterium]|nr:GNAT family N-acetyltransferase [Bacilli bacterium]